MSAAPGLGNLIRKLESLATNSFRYELARDMSVAALKRIGQQFAREQDPYGEPWKPLKYRVGKILDKTGEMKNSATASPSDTGFKLVFYAFYALFHQAGAFHGRRTNIASKKTYRQYGMPSRKLLPEQSKGLPREWIEDFQACLDRKVAERMR